MQRAPVGLGRRRELLLRSFARTNASTGFRTHAACSPANAGTRAARSASVPTGRTCPRPSRSPRRANSPPGRSTRAGCPPAPRSAAVPPAASPSSDPAPRRTGSANSPRRLPATITFPDDPPASATSFESSLTAPLLVRPVAAVAVRREDRPDVVNEVDLPRGGGGSLEGSNARESARRQCGRAQQREQRIERRMA